MKRLAVLISDVGKGSNFQAIVGAVNSKIIDAKIAAVISDTKHAPGLRHARKNKILIKICANKKDLLKLLKKLRPNYVVLAGWKQIILDEVIESYPNKILNLHPGLIPNSLKSEVLAPDGTHALWNKGLLANKAIQNFLDKKSTYAGSSIHFLTKDFDFGPVLERTFVKIKKNDTIESLYSRLKKNEHQIYIQALQSLTNHSYLGKTIMIVDGGGRGSALVDKYSQSKHVSKILAVPGNDLMPTLCKKPVVIFPKLKTTDTKEILKICKSEKVDLVDVAQDDAVAVGLTDVLTKASIKVFGPTKKASQIEWDKSWSRDFMKKFKLPVPQYKICKSEKEGIDYINKSTNSGWFIKASGLAAGKGAIHAANKSSAISAISKMKSFGTAGKTYLIEECLLGEEFSAFAIVTGNKFEIVGYAQDHKRAFDGDTGPNTGGMGCTSPPKVISKKVDNQVKKIIKKTVEGLVQLKRPYTGIIYLGGMVDKNQKVSIVEFNARWGDPEAQVILPAIKSDYFNFVSQALESKLIAIERDNLYRVAVTAASRGYPQDFSKVIGKKIMGLQKALKNKNVKLFPAAIKKDGNGFVAAGGRLFYLMAGGRNVVEARKKAYTALSKISVQGDNLYFRTDIGYRDLKRENKE